MNTMARAMKTCNGVESVGGANVDARHKYSGSATDDDRVDGELSFWVDLAPSAVIKRSGDERRPFRSSDGREVPYLVQMQRSDVQ